MFAAAVINHMHGGAANKGLEPWKAAGSAEGHGGCPLLGLSVWVLEGWMRPFRGLSELLTLLLTLPFKSLY